MARLEEKLSGFLETSQVPACVLFVDDGSSDGSGSLLEEMCSRNDAFYYIRFSANRGLSAALKAGIDYTESEYVGYIDADLQTDPEDFNLLFPYMKDYSMVTGIRTDRRDSAFKKLQSRIANGFRRMMTHDGAVDTGCPLKVFRTSCARRIPLFKGMHRFFLTLTMRHPTRVNLVQVLPTMA